MNNKNCGTKVLELYRRYGAAPAQASHAAMDRYFFDTAGDSSHRDDNGVELASYAAARVEAIRYAGEVMASEPGVLWDGNDFFVYARNSDGILLFTITCFATNAPAAGDVK